MSANPLELFTAYVGVNKPTKVERSSRLERRRRTRTMVHWPVLFFHRETAEAVESVTQNLSSGGFYCFLKTPFQLDESLTCTIRVPTHDPLGEDLDRRLDCQVRVIRVESDAPEGFFGIAFRIEDYHLAHGVDAGRTQ